MGAKAIEAILTQVKKYTSIENLEVTLEFNPENQSRDLLKSYLDAGVNRLSLGVQSFDANLLKRLGRTHSPQDSEQAIQNTLSVGFKNLSIDLMYDLPTQTLENWNSTLLKAMEYPIQHLSLYNLSIEKETVFYKKRDKIQKEMPAGELSLKMFEEAHRVFKAHGYHPYEISAFAKEGFYSHHNVGYWHQRPHLGFGPSAFSLIGSHRFQNVRNLRRYSEALDQNKLPIDFEETLSQEAFLRESLILYLRLYQGLNPKHFQKRFGPFSQMLQKSLQDLFDKKWLENSSEQIMLTSEGRLYHDTIASLLVL